MNKSMNVHFSELLPLISDTIQSGKSFTFTAFGNSMHPFLRGGSDRVTLSPPEAKIRVGDIVFYQRESGEFVLHRIVNIKEDKFTLCGDNQYILEKNIKKEQFIAQFSARERNGKILKNTSLLHQIWIWHLPVRRFLLHVVSFIKRRIQ